jgi:serine/threonine protein kinase
MEWVDGVTLYDWARLYQPTAQQVLRLLAQVALALQTLHAQGAVHRDVNGRQRAGGGSKGALQVR